MNGFIKVLVLEQEDDDVHFEIKLSNGRCNTELYFYGSPNHFKEFGARLIQFPSTINDIESFTIGEDNPKWAYYLHIKALCYDASGHTLMKVIVYNFGDIVAEHKSEFSILAEAASINRLGQMLLNWNVKEAKDIYWESNSF